MKVLICIPCLLIGGTEIQTLNLVRALIRGGHQVVLTCYFEYNQMMIQCFQNIGCKVICMSSTGTRIRGRKGYMFLFRNLRKILKIEIPDLVHVQYMAPGAIPILLLRLMGIRNIIATAHTMADIYSNLYLVHFIQKYCVHAFTCISRRAEESFFGRSQLYSPKTLLSKRNHFTIYNALPYYINICEDKRSLSQKEIMLGVVSRLERIKGMDLVIPVFARLRELYFNIRLLVVGDGSLRSIMEQQALKLEVNDSIEWVGRQKQSALQRLYDRIDILLIPSRSEGFGLTAIEGMARGCVVVASNTGGLPEVVKDGVTGVLHQTENMEDMIIKIHSLLEDRTKMLQFSQNSLSHALQFSFEKYAAIFCNLYERMN